VGKRVVAVDAPYARRRARSQLIHIALGSKSLR
jgi:hypothetical protein